MKDTLLLFMQITGKDLTTFFKKFINFTVELIPKIEQYYNEGDYSNTAFDTLDKLYEEVNEIIDIFEQQNSEFSNYRWYEFIEEIERIKDVLLSYKKSAKWLRLRIKDGKVIRSKNIDVSLKQNQTIEDISNMYFDDQEQWREIAFNNRIKETDYTLSGGTQVVLKTQEDRFNVESVVDELTIDNMLGKDIDREFTYVNNDVKVLSPVNTFRQSAEIMLSLTKGDNDGFLNIGKDKNVNNQASLLINVLMRQVLETFSTDDTVRSVSLVSFEREQKSAKITFNIESIIGDIIELNNEN